MQNIHPNYLQRYSINNTINQFNNFWYDETINNSSNFMQILANLEKTALEMRVAIVKGIKKERKLNKLISTD